MSGVGGGQDGADGRGHGDPLDELDQQILAVVKDYYRIADPPPPDLDDLVSFAIELDDLDVAIARSQPVDPAGADLVAGAGVRDGGAWRGQARTLTFDTGDLTIALSLAYSADELVRVDGWLVPPSERQIQLRLAPRGQPHTGRPLVARLGLADETGRFAFDRVPRGLAQVVVFPPESGGRGAVTPSIVL